MILTIKCPKCSKIYETNMPSEAFDKWHNGEPIQRAWPESTATERETLISGLCPDCQDEVFS